VFVYRNGSHGGVPAAKDMVDTARQFPSMVESQTGNATIYAFAVQDYASLVPSANLPSIANRLARLQEYGEWASRAAVTASDVADAPLLPATRAAWAASARNTSKRIADTVYAIACSSFVDPDTPAAVDPDVAATVEALEYNLTNPITQTSIVPPGQWIDSSWGPTPTLDKFVTKLIFYIDGDKIRGVQWTSNDGSYAAQADMSVYPYPFEFSKDGTETLSSLTITWTGYGYNTPFNVKFGTSAGRVYNPGLGGAPVVLDNLVSGRRIAGIFGARNPDNFIQSIGFYLGVVPKPLKL